MGTLAAAPTRGAALFRVAVLAAAAGTGTAAGCATAPKLVSRQGTDLLPRQAAPGKPEAYVSASPEAAQLALKLGNALAEAGIAVHLSGTPTPEARSHSYLVGLGPASAREDCSVAGRVAIAPPEPLALDPACDNQPLLLLRTYAPPPLPPRARPLWELRFERLDTFALTREEEHTLLEAVALWIRNRAVDQ